MAIKNFKYCDYIKAEKFLNKHYREIEKRVPDEYKEKLEVLDKLNSNIWDEDILGNFVSDLFANATFHFIKRRVSWYDFCKYSALQRGETEEEFDKWALKDCFDHLFKY